MHIIFLPFLFLLKLSACLLYTSDVYKRQQLIAALNPLKYFVEVMRTIYLRGGGLSLIHILFVQGAYGNPGLNMLKDDFSAYYVAGVRMSWNFGSLYTLRNDRRLIDNNRRKLETSRDVFLFNTNLESTQQSSAIQSMRRQMVDDDEIIRLRVNIRKAAEAKVENGTLTVTDMLR